MPLLSDAQKLFVGGTSINKVLSNGYVVWPKVTLNPCAGDLSNFYAAGDLVTRTAIHDASYYTPYPRKDATWLTEVFFWAPKCIDDPDNNYCSPVVRFIGEEFDPCPGYNPGENWWGTSDLFHFVLVNDDQGGGNSANLPTRPHDPGLTSFGTEIRVERYGTQEEQYNGVPFWWYRLYAYECFKNPNPPCEYSDEIAMCGREPGDINAGVRKFQIKLKHKSLSAQVVTYKKTNFDYSGRSWGTGANAPIYGFDTNP